MDIIEALCQHSGQIFRPTCPLGDGAMARDAKTRTEQQCYLERYGVPTLDWEEYPAPRLADIRAALRRARPAAPGPDGLPAAASAAVSSGANFSHRALQWMLDGQHMRSDYNHAIGIFLPKGTKEADVQRVARTACCTRPLSLRNTGAKAISSALSRPIKRAV